MLKFLKTIARNSLEYRNFYFLNPLQVPRLETISWGLKPNSNPETGSILLS